MNKVYKVPLWEILFFSLLFLGGGLAMLIFEEKFLYRFAGVIMSLMSIYVFRVLYKTKIIISEEYLISDNYLSSFSCQRKQIRLSEIAEFNTSSSFIGIGAITYVISKLDNSGNGTKRLRNIASDENIIIILSFIKNYRHLITEIFSKAPYAHINGKTKKIVDAK